MKINSRLYKLRLLPALVLAAVLTMALFTATAKSRKNSRADWDRIARQRKGDYVFASAYQALVSESIGGAIVMLDYARALKPDDKAIAGNVEQIRIVTLDLDSAQADKSYRIVRDAWRNDRDDYDMGEFLAAMGIRQDRHDDVVEVWRTLDSIYPTHTDPSVKLAEAYTRRYIYQQDTADYYRALRIYDRLEKESGKDVGLSSQKIRTLQLRNDTAAIDAEVASLLKALPGESTPLLFASMVSKTMGRDSMELVYLNLAAEADSTDGSVFIRLADFYRERGDSLGYRNEVFRSLESANLDFEVKDRILRGYLTELYTDSTEWPRIEQLFGILQNLHPDEPDMYALNGLFEASRDNYNLARELLGYAVALEPSNESLRTMLVQTDISADSLDAVINDARPGLEFNPDQLYFPIMMASAMSQQKRFEPAISLLKSIDVDNPANPVAASNLITTLADIYQQSGQSDSAFATYDRALAINPENYMAYNNAAYHMAVLGTDLEKADRFASYAIADDPENSTYLDTYAWVKFKQQEYKDAKTYIDKAMNNIIDVAEFREYLENHPEIDTFVHAEPVDMYDTDAIGATDSVPAEVLDSLMLSVELDEIDGADSVGYAVTDTVPATEVVIKRNLAELDKYDKELGADILEHAGDIYYMCGEPDDALLFWKRALALKPEDNELLARKIKAKAYLYK